MKKRKFSSIKLRFFKDTPGDMELFDSIQVSARIRRHTAPNLIKGVMLKVEQQWGELLLPEVEHVKTEQEIAALAEAQRIARRGGAKIVDSPAED